MSEHTQHYTNEARKALEALKAHNTETTTLLIGAQETKQYPPGSFWEERNSTRDILRVRLETYVELLLETLP